MEFAGVAAVESGSRESTASQNFSSSSSVYLKKRFEITGTQSLEKMRTGRSESHKRQLRHLPKIVRSGSSSFSQYFRKNQAHAGDSGLHLV